MKKFLLVCLLMAFAFAADAQKKSKNNLTLEWKYINVIDGYYHDSMSKIYLNGELVGESSVTKNSELNSCSIKVPKGDHVIKLSNYSKYNGNWEEVLIDNNYSLDAFYETILTFKKKKDKKRITIVFDIDTEEVTANIN